MTHIVSVPFTGLGLYNGYRGDAWLAHRIKVFKEYTLQSLLNQTDKDFILWLQFRPEEKENQYVKGLWNTLSNIRGLKTIFTYHGICLYDDKYEEEAAVKRLFSSLKGSLPELESSIKDDWVYLTCQPSDDMYSTKAFEEIKNVEPEESLSIGWDKGYMMNYGTKEVAEYNPDTLPPFQTLVFPTDIFLDPEKHLYYIGPYKSHEEVKDYFSLKLLKGRGFAVGTHGGNISTVWTHPYRGKAETDKVLFEFGVWDSEAIRAFTSPHLFLRTIVNKLPKPIHNVIKYWYRKLFSI